MYVRLILHLYLDATCLLPAKGNGSPSAELAWIP